MKEETITIKREYRRVLKEGRILAEAMVERPLLPFHPKGEAFYQREAEALFRFAETTLAQESARRNRTLLLSASLTPLVSEGAPPRFLRRITVKAGSSLLYRRERRERLTEEGLVLPEEGPRKKKKRIVFSRKV